MSKLKLENKGRALFNCPGCKLQHPIRVSGEDAWQWNGSVDAPTLTPSVLFTAGHYATGHNGRCWCTYNKEHPDEEDKFFCVRCHSHITDGKIMFLGDCSHELAGQTVDLPEI